MSHKNKRRNRENRSGPPTLADIVREKTNDGKVIVDFYLDVVRGKLDDEGFEVCHRLEAAEQVHAIAPGLVAEYIAQLTGVECNHVIRRRRTRPTTVVPAEAGTHPRSDANSARARHEALEYLASALAAPSLADDPRVAGIVHESTDHGKTVVSFLLHVMHGVVRGFRPRQRVQAASELLGHIAHDELARTGFLRAEPVLSPAEGPALSAVEGSSPSSREPTSGSSSNANESSFPRRACPVLDTGREPIPGQGETDAEVDQTVIPAKSLPRTRYGAGTQTQSGDGSHLADTGSAAELPTKNPELTTKNPPDHRGCYDIDRKIAEAQHDPAHPIHKFVQAYDEVAAAFHREDKRNDDDEEVRYWISGEVPDAYGKYIWEYAQANPRSIRRKLRPKRRRSREPGTTPKAESVWMPRPSDKMREAGIPKPRRTLMWI